MFTNHRIALQNRRSLWMALGLFVATTALVEAQGPPNGLPPQASPVAQSMVEGELEVQIEDSEAGSRTHHFVHTGNRRIRLELAGDGPGWESGTIVRARGRFRDAETLELGGGGSLEPMALANSNTFGEQRTIVILVNFAGNEQQPYSAAHASGVTFGETGNFFLENSHGQTWLTGVVAGWFTINVNTSTCDSNGIASAADQAASAAGYNLSQFKRKVYAFPKINACGWWGLGSVGGNPSRAWINGTFALKVVAHELGHNFGDYHSRSQSCAPTGCSVSEYGDDADVMGNPTSGHMNAFQKERLGWLNYGDAPAIQAVGATGNYWIDSYAGSTGTAPKALKIQKSVDGAGNRTWLYVEARTQTGFDGGVAPGVVLHSGYEGNGREIYQLDVDPFSTNSDWRMDPGQSFTDAAIGVRITTLWGNATGSMIEVVFENNPCTTSAPSLSASPSGPVTTTAGAAVTYSVNVTNNDSSACSSDTFNIEHWVPAGWTGSASPPTLSLAPGASGGASVTITPSSSATGISDIQIGAYRSGGSGASLVRTIEISPVATGPIELDLDMAEGKGGAYDFSALVRAGSSPVSGATVTFTVTLGSTVVASVTAVTNGSGVATASYRPAKGKNGAKGSHTVSAVTSASGQTATASLQFTVR